VDDAMTVAALEKRVTELEALVARLAEGHASGAVPERPTALTPTSEPPADVRPTPTLDRRRLLTRGSTAAVAAVLGGTAVGIASASPAAADTGTFDTSTSAPALTATTSTGTGSAVAAVSTGPGLALHATGPSTLDGPVKINSNTSTTASALTIRAEGPHNSGLVMQSEANGVLILANGTGLWAVGDLAVEATGDKVGLLAAGSQAQIILAGTGSDVPMAPPRTRSDQHDRGEFYFDDAGSLWLCTAEGTPGTWSLIGGAGTAGAFTVLPSPVRVYDSRPGYDPTTGPKAELAPGVDRTIDCTLNTSGIPTDANALAATITITNPTGPGWLSVRANGATYNGTSTLNWATPDAIAATTTTTALGPNATIALRTHVPTDAIVDVIGYWR